MEKNLQTLFRNINTGIKSVIILIKILFIITLLLIIAIFLIPLIVLILLLKRVPTFSEIKKWHNLIMMEDK